MKRRRDLASHGSSDRAEGVWWTDTIVNLAFGANSSPRALAAVHASSDDQEALVPNVVVA